MKRTEYDNRYNELIRKMEAEIDVVRAKYADELKQLWKDFEQQKRGKSR